MNATQNIKGHQQLLVTIRSLQTSNTQLLSQIYHLHQQKSADKGQRQQMLTRHQEKVRNLSTSLQNLRQKISLLENFQIPASKISHLQRQVENLQAKNSKLESQIRDFKDLNSQIQNDLLKVMEEDKEDNIQESQSQDKQGYKPTDHEKQKQIQKESEIEDEKEREQEKQKEREKEDDSFYRLSNSISIMEKLEPQHIEEQIRCKQCQTTKEELQQMKILVEKLSAESLQRTNQFEYGKSFLQSKILELEHFIQLQENEMDNFKNENRDRSKQLEIMKMKEKQLIKSKGEAQEKAKELQYKIVQLENQIKSLQESLEQAQLKKLTIVQSSPSTNYSSSSESALQQELDTKIRQLLIIKNQAINCTDLYISKCRQLQQKRISFEKALSEYQYKIQQLTITTQGLSNQRKTQCQTYQQMITFLKQELQRLQATQYQQQPTEFNQVLKMQIDEINSLHEAVKFKNEEVLKLKQMRSELQVSMINIKGELEMQKLKKITEIKNVQINTEIINQNLRNQLNIFKKSEQSLVNKLKYLTEQCRNKDQFIQKHIKNKNIQGCYETLLSDYQTLTNMKEFRSNLHHQIVLIDKLSNEKVILMQSIKKLEDLNKMNQNEIEDVG